MIVLSGVQFNAISVMNSSSLMTRGERSILNFDPRCFCSLMTPRCAFCVPECLYWAMFPKGMAPCPNQVVRTTYASFTGDSLEDFRPQLH